MTFVSYAQNFEDVMLWRALRDVEVGTYLDIGAQDPVHDSVSRAFYDLGWRGVHVEPTPRYAAALRSDRPDERVIEALVGSQRGIATLFEIAETGLSTGIDAIAERHRANGLEPRTIQAPVVSLAYLFDLFEGRDIHWMKIDVEGMESDVLRSWGDHSARPWVVAIESCEPMSQVPSHDQWLDEMVARDYREVYYDGLNRFFVADARAELAEAFTAPPNVFDGFVVPDGHFTGTLLRQQRDEAKSAADAAERAKGTARDEATALESAVAEARGRAEQALAEVLAAEQAQSALREEAASLTLAVAEACSQAQQARAEFLITEQAGIAAREQAASLELAVAEARDAADHARAELLAAQHRHASAEAESRASHAEREAQLGDQLRDANAALQAAADQRADLQAEFARRIEAAGAAHVEQIDRMATARAERESDLSRSLDAAFAKIADANVLFDRAASLIGRMHLRRGGKWTMSRGARDHARQMAAIADEMAAHRSSAGLVIAPPTGKHEVGDMAATYITISDEDGRLQAHSVDQLLSLDDLAFVRSAYLTVLGRTADPQGESHYLTLLRQGVAKLHILRQMRRSPEGRSHDPGLSELDRATSRYWWGRTPLAGPLIRAFSGTEGNSRGERRHRAVMNQVAIDRREVHLARSEFRTLRTELLALGESVQRLAETGRQALELAASLPSRPANGSRSASAPSFATLLTVEDLMRDAATGPVR